MSDWTTKKVEQFIIVNQQLGKGCFGTVYRGCFVNDENRFVAVKTIPMKHIKDSEKLQELIRREVDIMKKIQHPNIVQLYHVSRTAQNLYMFLEYCNDGDLREYLAHKEDHRLSELEAVLYIKHVLKAFKLLNRAKVIHRDIKPANILLHNGTAKVSDFGLARVIEQDDPARFSMVGSPQYMAPQILAGDPFSSKCDIWSVGMMFYQLLYGKCPWEAESQLNLYKAIKSQPLIFPQNPIRSQTIKQLIRDMLRIDEKDRITWEVLFQHPVVTIDEEQIRKNVGSIMQAHDHIVRSASLNKLYMDNNLVIGYIRQVDLTITIDNCVMVQQSKFLDANGNDKSLLISYEQEAKTRKGILKINNYFLFERNIAFFFNLVIQKIINIMAKKIAPISNDYYYRLLFVISKNQQVHLETLAEKLRLKETEDFPSPLWNAYLKSEDYQVTCHHVNSNCQHSLLFFTEILKKTLQNVQVANQIINDKSPEEIAAFTNIIDNDFKRSKQFVDIYQITIKDFLEQLDPIIASISKKQEQQSEIVTFEEDGNDYTQQEQMLLQIKLFLKIANNCYQWFDKVTFDFSKFYEEMETLSNDSYIQLIEKIKL